MDMTPRLLPFLAAWALMMAAMMLPSAAPFILLYRRNATALTVGLLTVGYLTVWTLAGIPAYLVALKLPIRLAPLVLAIAGIYQLTPFKYACLSKCRSPADFLIQRWGRNAFRLGFEHGLWCLGCCWALMLVLVLVGSMGMAWVVGLAALVAVEKLTKHGVAWSRVTGVAFLIFAFVKEFVR
jgi:predicted metal-binding membrane protein